MSVAVSNSPANQDRPLLQPSPLPSDHHHQRGSRREGRIRTLLDLITIEKMDGLDHHRTTIMMPSNGASSRWRILRERLGFNAVGCCGIATWRHNNNYQDSVAGDDDDDSPSFEEAVAREADSPAREGMNLAAALAAERELRLVGENVGVGVESPLATPSRVSLMRLLEETAVEEEVAVTVVGGGGGGDINVNINSSNNNDSVCCVCMGRKKGAAFIPCGHTYCRVCSRELWLNRGSCPLCNRRILEILDIF